MDEQPTRIHQLGDEAAWRDVVGTGPAAPPYGEPSGSEPPQPPRRSRAFATGAGLVLGGVLVGTVAVTAAQAAWRGHDASNVAQVSDGRNGFGTQGGVPQQGNGPQQGVDPQQRGRFFGGGRDGEQRLTGTVTAVGSGSISVRSSAGTASYAVTSATDIVKNGQRVALSSIAVGDDVLVHVYPSGSGMAAERIFAGTFGNGGFGGPGFGPGAGPDDGNGAGTANGTTGRST